MIGRSLAQFKVTSKLGEGGMGEVYRATDTRLKRDVAIKVLPSAFASDPSRLARMEREARAVAALNHPNIGAIYGFEEAEGIRFLVLELVEGETIADLLSRGPLEITQALRIGRQVAFALEAAHNHGLIHRDLKPDNIKVTRNGEVKILDFGLAKWMDEARDIENDAVTESMARTATGTIVGTPLYMSPEQARGQDIDKRTDLWAFGCILYELLCGGRAFQGTTHPDVLVAVLTHEPDWSLLPQGVPQNIRNLIRRCLKKNPQERMRDAGDAALEIDAAQADRDQSITARPPRRRSISSPVLGILAGAGVGLIVGLLFWLRVASEPKITEWAGELLLGGSSVAYGPRISPDGQTLAFQAIEGRLNQIGIAKVGTGGWRLLTHERERGPILQTSWSMDGSRLFLVRNSDIFSISPLGGEERLVLRDGLNPEQLPDGSLLVFRRDADGDRRVYRYWPQDARLSPVGPKLLALPPWRSQLRIFPDGREAVFFGVLQSESSTNAFPRLYMLDVGSGQAHPLDSDAGLFTQSFSIPLAIGADGQSVVTAVPAGDLHRVIIIPRKGGVSRTLLSLTSQPWQIDVDREGNLYIDQCGRPLEVIQFPVTGGTPARIARSSGISMERSAPLALPDGRVLVTGSQTGRSRVLVARTGETPTEFVETPEETSGPFSLVGADKIAFFMGSPTDSSLALATLDGLVEKRVSEIKGDGVTGLTSSVDGRMIYVAGGGFVSAYSVNTGRVRKVCEGERIAINPRTGNLVVLRNRSGEKLYEVSPEGAEIREIPYRSAKFIASWSAFAGNAIDRKGRILIPIFPPDSWFESVGLLDSESGVIEPIPAAYDGDIEYSGWSTDGQVVSAGLGITGSIWKLHALPASVRRP